MEIEAEIETEIEVEIEVEKELSTYSMAVVISSTAVATVASSYTNKTPHSAIIGYRFQ
tara:strand:- start:344 stop:517 length:174 start_codon:yes stop_codon:yes gene_type:complete